MVFLKYFFLFNSFLAFPLLYPLDIENSSSLIHALIETDYHKESLFKTSHLYQLDEKFFSDLKKEILSLIKTQTPSTVNDPTHVTYWTRPFGTALQYSLLNSSGKFDDYSSDHDKSIYGKKFHHASTYPCLAKFLSFFTHATNFRVNVLMPKSGLSQHEEGLYFTHSKTNKSAMRVRFHLPIVTNAHCEMFLDGNIYHFEEGNIYFFHNGCVHAASNLDPTGVRIHLVWDMLLTEDTFTRMFKRSSPASFLKRCKNTHISPTRKEPINPSYARANKESTYDLAKQACLCIVQ